MNRLLLALVVAVLIGTPAWAVEPNEVLDDPVLEARARELSKGLRCLVCQNQSIDDSNAALARDLRILVRERLTAGDTDEQVIDFVVSRYGDFVLLKPPFKLSTLALWFGPIVIALLAMLGAIQFFRRQTVAVPKPADGSTITDDERKRLEKLLEGDPS